MTTVDNQPSVWERIAAPLPASVIQWRQQGKPVARDGKHIARFVAYIDAQFVRERLDSVIPGEWDVTLNLLPPAVTTEGEEIEPFSFQANLQILGVHRESVGSGKDYKTAETDAFKRAAVRFGIGSELYAMDPLWVQVDGDGKFAKPVESPAAVYARKGGHAAPTPVAPARVLDRAGVVAALDMASEDAEPVCPKCEGRLYDNRAENDARAAKGEKLRPDWKCRDRNCDGVIWRPKAEKAKAAPAPQMETVPPHTDDDQIPF